MQSQPSSGSKSAQSASRQSAKVIPIRLPSRWHDPLKLIQTETPSHGGRAVLWAVSLLTLILIVWAAFGQLDIIASADGKLVPQTLVKIVQPAEAGVVQQLLVQEGDRVKAGQVLARLDTTLANADKAGISSDLAIQQMQGRRLEAELADQPMQSKASDDPLRYAQVHSQYLAHRNAFNDSLEQEKSLLAKAEHERKSALQIVAKLEQTLPTYQKSAASFADLAKEGFVSAMAAAEKERELIEKTRDLEAQKSAVAALDATIAAQQRKISQIGSQYKSELQKELADVRARINQLQPSLDKSSYKAGLMELKAPQDGVIKDLATTTTGAVVQPGTVIMTLVPEHEPLYADVMVKNEDVGFVRAGQAVQIKLAAYPFQQYGMVKGKVMQVSADASEAKSSSSASAAGDAGSMVSSLASYKARVQLDQQVLKDPQGRALALTPGMQVVAEIHQGKRTVLEYLLSPVRKIVQEAGRER